MGVGDEIAKWKRAATRILDLAARPVRTAHGGEGIVLQPYRGYGSRRDAFLIGRVFRQSAARRDAGRDDLAAHLRDVGRRIARRAVRGATVTARFCGAEHRAETDRDGYFRLHLEPRQQPSADRSWHPVDLLLEGERPVRAEGQVFIPPRRCRFVVISDIDDTIMYTGVANKLAMLWRLFVEDAERRIPFPGVTALYRALHDGVSGNEGNPMLYVSRGPWGIYDVLDEFFRMHDVPVGPILFLREWGISWKSPLPRRAEDHKQDLIRNMLELYGDLPFVLIGDSGQHDPEVYRDIVEENPGRVLAVLIRNVSRDEERVSEIEDLARAVAAAGSSLLLAADSSAMAEHVAKLDLVAPGTVAAVERAMSAGHGGKTPSGTRRIRPDRAGAESELRGAVGDETGDKAGEAAPNVVVEQEDAPPKAVKPPAE